MPIKSSVTSISSFTGPYRFLSNFYPGDSSSLEHKYQARKMKTLHDSDLILNCALPGQAKKLARTLPIREDWDKIKLSVMEELLREKFKDPTLRDKLLSTFPLPLIEGNTWGDTFWGMCNGIGENNLGKLLMKIRLELSMEAV